MLKKQAGEARVTDLSPHDFRRTFVGDLLDKGVDIVTVQKLTGQTSVETRGRYNWRPEAVKQQAAKKCISRNSHGDWVLEVMRERA